MEKDKQKFKVLLSASAGLVIAILAFSVLRETVIPDIENYLKRRVYYESTISKKGLSLHQGSYWKEKQ